MYRGSNIVSLDEKNRLAIPKKLRTKLFEESTNLIITAHPEKCLLLYSSSEWMPIEKKLMSLSSFDKRISALQRLLVGYAEEISQDKAGRILLSQPLKDFASIGRNVIILGQGSHFEIWDKNLWDENVEQSIGNISLESIEELGGFSL
jgi:MraZ protein